MKKIIIGLFVAAISLLVSAQDDTFTLSKETINSLSSVQIKPDGKPVKKAVYSGAHSKYLNDKIEFWKINFSAGQAGKTYGVIGKNETAMYDSVGGKIIEKLPLGKIIEILEVKKNPNGPYGTDVFDFENNTNYWMRTSYNGKSGWVFGAYVANEDFWDYEGGSFQKEMIYYSYYVQKKAKAEKFSDLVGKKKISADVQTRLIRDRIAFEEVGRTFRKDTNIDDIYDLYGELHSDTVLGDMVSSSFITTDLVAHSLHLLFNNMLEDSEMRFMSPAAINLAKSFYNEADRFEAMTSSPKAKESAAFLKKYFAVALAVAGESVSNDKDVEAEANLISAAEGYSRSPLMGYSEDYSLFRPRGHYNKNEALQKYFKLMMWFGKMSFICDERNAESLKNTRNALLAVKLAKDNPEAMKLFFALDNPVRYLIGEPTGYNLRDFASILDDKESNGFDKWAEDDENIKKFIGRASGKLKQQSVSVVSYLNNEINADESTKPVIVFRFFGQRLTPDTLIQQELSSPKVGTVDRARNMIKGLDLMGVYGSALAEKLLAEDMKSYKNYEKNFEKLKKNIDAMSDEAWKRTYYSGHIRIIRELAKFGKSDRFFFTKTDRYDNKALLAASASWAELRHDTILYQEQYAAEMGGGGELSWDITRVTPPVNYVEPNLAFYYWCSAVVKNLIDMGQSTKFMSETYIKKMQNFEKYLDELTAISELEAADKPISEKQNHFIISLPSSLWYTVKPEAEHFTDKSDLRMAVIADVHTDAVAKRALETAIGKPHRIYVSLNDGQGGRRVAIGYVFSYYEFQVPISGRMTDEEWKEKVYSEQADEKGEVKKLMPKWEQEIFE